MKIPLCCSECLKENLTKEKVPPNTGIVADNNTFEFKIVEMNDDGQFEMECIKGHKTKIIVQNEKFEILFDMGLSALNDGYKHEAIACVTASVERFYEWCIKVFLHHNNINLEHYEETWKYVKNNSQRQLGAFYLLYLQTFNEVPKKFCENKQTPFRNNVIHNGKIPTYDEAYEYIEYVFNFIRTILKQIKSRFTEEIAEISFIKLSKSKTTQLSTLYIPTILSREEDITLKEAISKLKRQK